MSNYATNPCIRCGKERILLRSWKETVPTLSGAFVEVIRAENICPDAECQIIVQLELTKQKESRDKVKREREARVEEMRKQKGLLSSVGKDVI